MIGKVTLQTNTSALFYGNHPAYLHCHPKYDVDDCLKPELVEFMKNMRDKFGDRITEAQLSSALSEAAIEYIVSDPVAFLYRAILKTQWHWFNLQKIPNFTVGAYWDREKRAIIVENEIKLGYSLVYVMYKIIYIPLFLVAIVYIFWRKRWEWIPFIVLFIALWPIVIMTAPDTRFKMLQETLAIVPIILSSSEIVKEIRNKRYEQF